MKSFALLTRITSPLCRYKFKQATYRSFHATGPVMIKAGTCVHGENGRQYRLVSPLSAQVAKTTSNVWKAVDSQDETLEFVIKAPSQEDDASLGWPLFQHEVRMQKRFSKSPFIRQMVDFIPSSSTNGDMMVLQAFEKSLWTARNKRALTMNEIKWIMKGVLIALWTIHREGLVYSDLKMENVLLNGFDNNGPAEIHSIIARLADCGAVTTPSSREITSITYRSPEVYFGKPWRHSTDIWSWGIVYCHLLEARANLESPGIYDSIRKGTIEEKTKAVRDTMALDFSLQSIQFYTDDPESYKLLPTNQVHQSDDEWWGEKLLRKGLPVEEIEFLVQVLNPDPNERPTAEEIIRSGFLEIEEV